MKMNNRRVFAAMLSVCAGSYEHEEVEDSQSLCFEIKIAASLFVGSSGGQETGLRKCSSWNGGYQFPKVQSI